MWSSESGDEITQEMADLADSTTMCNWSVIRWAGVIPSHIAICLYHLLVTNTYLIFK